MKKCVNRGLLYACALTIVFAAVLIGALLLAPSDSCSAALVDILTPEIIELYETEIAHSRVVSSKSEEWLSRTAERYDISVQKVKAVLIVQSFCALTGEEMSFPQLAELGDHKLLELVKQRSSIYTDSLSDEQKEALKQRAGELLGFKIK